LLVDVGIERVVGIRKRRQLIRHGPLLSDSSVRGDRERLREDGSARRLLVR
jgi:hypothetical protein